MQETTQVVKAVINGKLPRYEYKSQKEKKMAGGNTGTKTISQRHTDRDHMHMKKNTKKSKLLIMDWKRP